jgi:gas vesicle protein
MKKHDNAPHNTNFWFGFALGSITLSAAAYLLGTKKGREKLKKLVEYADTVEDLPEEFFALLPAIKEMLKQESEKAEKTTPASEHSSPGQSLASILEKVKSTAEEMKEEKKFFSK